MDLTTASTKVLNSLVDAARRAGQDAILTKVMNQLHGRALRLNASR